MPKPKRPFIPLSWEHHHGLSLVWRIRRGLERQIPPDAILSYVLPFWDKNVALHFDLEEATFLPVVPQDEPMVQKFLDDHRVLRARVESVKTEGKKDAVAVNLKSVADLLEQHIRFEERELFPWIARELSAETRETVEKNLHEKFHRLVEPESPPFWE